MLDYYHAELSWFIANMVNYGPLESWWTRLVHYQNSEVGWSIVSMLNQVCPLLSWTRLVNFAHELGWFIANIGPLLSW